jgi:membrane protein required for colicin V production
MGIDIGLALDTFKPMFENLSSINIGSLTMFDLVFISSIAISTIFGVYRGLIRSVVSFIGWILAFYFAIKFSGQFAYLFEKYSTSSTMANLLSTLVLFLFFALVIAVINGIVTALCEPICGGIIDRSIGLLFGLVRGLVLASLAFYFLLAFWPELNVKDREEVFKEDSTLPQWAKKSETLLLLIRGSNFVAEWLPDQFRAGLKQSISESIDEEGNLTLPMEKASKIRHINDVLKKLPNDFLDMLHQDDIVKLQDSEVSNQSKVNVLEKIADQYQEFSNKKIESVEDQDEVNKLNRERQHTLALIERAIRDYNQQG